MHIKHQQSKSKQKGAKHSGSEVEEIVSRAIASTGVGIEALAENGGYKCRSADLAFNGRTWDVKYIDNANENTIRSYLKNARKADCVIFYSSDDRTSTILRAIDREVGRYEEEGRKISELPDVYKMTSDNKLVLVRKMK